MSERRFVTMFPVSPGMEEEVRRLFDTIQEGDPTWLWEFKQIGEESKVVIYSRGKNQAKMRGAWLQGRTELFDGLPYTTTHNLTMRTSLKEKPKKVEGLRVLLKRDKIWEKASKEHERQYSGGKEA